MKISTIRSLTWRQFQEKDKNLLSLDLKTQISHLTSPAREEHPSIHTFALTESPETAYWSD